MPQDWPAFKLTFRSWFVTGTQCSVFGVQEDWQVDGALTSPLHVSHPMPLHCSRCRSRTLNTIWVDTLVLRYLIRIIALSFHGFAHATCNNCIRDREFNLDSFLRMVMDGRP